MKTIIIITTALVLSVTTAFAQNNTPTPPPPPETSVSVHSDSESSKSYSYSIHTDDDKNGGNVSISTSSNDDSYSFRLKYDGAKDAQIKDLLYKEIGTNNSSKSGNKTTWTKTSGGEEVYEIRFSKGRLRMDVDKEIASEDLVKKITTIGKQVRTMISGNNDAKRKAEQLQRDADRLRRDADRMRREADRLRRQEERNTDQIRREAERLARSAHRADGDARKSGGVSAVVSILLNDTRTLYDGVDKGTDWLVPKLLPELTKQLRKDGFIIDTNELNILNEDGTMYVNGTQVPITTMWNYNDLFKKFGIRGTYSFSLNKTKQNIVIVDNNAIIDNILFTLRTINIIPKKDKKLVLEINGNSVIRNGERLSLTEVKLINKLLLSENVIPAPGKTLQIKREGNYTLGYTIDKTHLGTWVMDK